MFKKRFSLGLENIVSNKDKKLIIQKLPPTEFDFMLDKKVELKVTKITGAKAKLYFQKIEND